MKRTAKLRERGKEFIDTIIRFLLVIIFLIAAVIINAISIIQEYSETNVKLLITFSLGACIYAVFQLIYERFCVKVILRYLFMGITLVLTFLYYILIREATSGAELSIRTTVIFFILLIAFLWVPVIKSSYNFNDSFMAAFKAFFVAAFFNGILFLGITLIYGATDRLILNVNEHAYMHTANIIFLLLTPIHTLSLIPYYQKKGELSADKPVSADGLISADKPVSADKIVSAESPVSTNTETVKVEAEHIEGAENAVIKDEITSYEGQVKREEAIRKLITPAKFLETLISYVIIPITAVFTIILLLYIVLNITGDFWTDNLMEPLLVSYTIVVIIVYLLASTINNTFTKYFRMIFPKMLIPVVLFQTLSSILKIQEAGISYGRYYVILFGVFATVASILFSVIPIRKNGIIAPILIVLSVISIFPYIDVFTISKVNQIGRLEHVLERNNMLSGDTIVPNADISEEDKKIIVSSVEYMNRMEYTKDITWLKDYSNNYNFEKTFGFVGYVQPKTESNRYIIIIRNKNSPIPILGNDFMVHFNSNNNASDMIIDNYEKNGKTYQLSLVSLSEYDQVILLKEAGKEIIRFSLNNIYSKFINNNQKSSVNTEEVTFTQENDLAVLTIIAESIDINVWEEGRNQQSDIYVLVKIK